VVKSTPHFLRNSIVTEINLHLEEMKKVPELTAETEVQKVY